jgi:hypothetical protein
MLVVVNVQCYGNISTEFPKLVVLCLEMELQQCFTDETEIDTNAVFVCLYTANQIASQQKEERTRDCWSWSCRQAQNPPRWSW